MRRDLVAASGVWFHGGLAQPVISSASFRQKLNTDSGATPRTRPNSDCGGEDTTSYLYAVSIIMLLLDLLLLIYSVFLYPAYISGSRSRLDRVPEGSG